MSTANVELSATVSRSDVKGDLIVLEFGKRGFNRSDLGVDTNLLNTNEVLAAGKVLGDGERELLLGWKLRNGKRHESSTRWRLLTHR